MLESKIVDVVNLFLEKVYCHEIRCSLYMISKSKIDEVYKLLTKKEEEKKEELKIKVQNTLQDADERFEKTGSIW